MMWVKFKMSEIDPSYLDISGKRFPEQDVLLYELVDYHKYIVKRFFKDCLSPTAVINTVIVKIKYPLDVRGNPTDFHYFQAFRRIWGSCIRSYRNEYDFFQFASETAWLRYGDCEDSSILTAAGLELKNTQYFVAFGAVYLYERLLGYHAWIVAKLDNVWRLVETTLDRPYQGIDEIPIININTNKWSVGDLLYEAYVLWNTEELWEWSEESKKVEKMIGGLKKYLEKSFKDKEKKSKYKEMNKAYMKYMKKGLKVK